MKVYGMSVQYLIRLCRVKNFHRKLDRGQRKRPEAFIRQDETQPAGQPEPKFRCGQEPATNGTPAPAERSPMRDGADEWGFVIRITCQSMDGI